MLFFPVTFDFCAFFGFPSVFGLNFGSSEPWHRVRLVEWHSEAKIRIEVRRRLVTGADSLAVKREQNWLEPFN